MIRPQQQRVKQLREMVDNVRRGDTVVTAGGIVGKVVKASRTKAEVLVEIADNVQVTRAEGDASAKCAPRATPSRTRTEADAAGLSLDAHRHGLCRGLAGILIALPNALPDNMLEQISRLAAA